MNENLLKKMELLQKVNTDDSNFIFKICKAYLNDKKHYENKAKTTSIVLSDKIKALENNIINLDSLWATPYFYTRMKTRIIKIVNSLLHTNNSDILSNSSKLLHKIIYTKNIKTIEKFQETDAQIDIVDFIKSLDKKKKLNPDCNFDFIFTASQINEETLFKEEQLKKAIEIINIDSIEERYENIYDDTYNYLQKDFISNCYCDFCNNKCIAQRRLIRIYPITTKNGCCYTNFGYCSHLKNGSCDAKCIACTLYSCQYLTKRGIGYWATEFILLNAFFNQKQRHHLVFDFFKTREEILQNLKKRMIECEN